jgi:predicted enzyme related to lactoylglutathione lyase
MGQPVVRFEIIGTDPGVVAHFTDPEGNLIGVAGSA